MRGGRFLHDDPGVLDAAFFNVTAVEAWVFLCRSFAGSQVLTSCPAMDPEQHILLGLSYEALDNG